MADHWTSEVEEVVARAMCNPATGWDLTPEKQRAQYRTYARRALTALAGEGLLAQPGGEAPAPVSWPAGGLR